MSGPDDKVLLKLVALIVVGAVALFVAWVIDRRKVAKKSTSVDENADGTNDKR